MNKTHTSISPEKRAEQYQSLARQKKEIEGKLKLVHNELKSYAESHRDKFDQANQIKFKNGVTIALRHRRFIDGDHEQIIKAFGEVFVVRKLDEKKLLDQISSSPVSQRKLENNGGKVDFKEIIAITAN